MQFTFKKEFLSLTSLNFISTIPRKYYFFQNSVLKAILLMRELNA